MENAITLTESNFDREVNNSDKPVLVDFWAEWCGPCKLIAPLIDEIAREKGDAVKVGKVNIDENQNLSFKFKIRAIPTLLIFKNGQVRDQVTGMTSKKDLVRSDKPVLVDFWAEWCGPCKLIAPLIDEIAREKGDAVKVGKVNIDENQNLSFKFKIRAIPTLLIFKNGQVRDQVTGMTSKKDLVGRIDALA